MRTTMNECACAAAWVLMLATGSVAMGQEQGPPPAKSDGPTVPPVAEPTLDDLLGIKPAEASKASPEGGKDAAKAELDRQLSAVEMDDEFEQAVKLMSDTARRLGEAKDAGLDTQRMQEQTLTKLDKLIDMAKSQKQKKSKSKKKQEQQDQQQQQQDQQNKQSSQQNQQGQQEQQQQQGANAQGGVVAGQSGKLNAPPGAGAAWGQLPERLREALMQGTNDYTSDKWKALTREYYKRLAEQPGGSK